jgi:hypothetical protein
MMKFIGNEWFKIGILLCIITFLAFSFLVSKNALEIYRSPQIVSVHEAPPRSPTTTPVTALSAPVRKARNSGANPKPADTITECLASAKLEYTRRTNITNSLELQCVNMASPDRPDLQSVCISANETVLKNDGGIYQQWREDCANGIAPDLTYQIQ